MKQKKLHAIVLSPEEMKAESSRWIGSSHCGVTGICPDGHKISCQAVKEDENTCKKLYLEFGGSGYLADIPMSIGESGFETNESGASSGEILHGVSCGSTTIYCSDKPSEEMPRKVTACLYKQEWDTCKFLTPNGSLSRGYCRYGDPGANGAYKDYLYCSDLGVTSKP